jgi:glycosyltransferase involved in cell wall biosynthesis
MVVDDGSTDDTHELVQRWIGEAAFPIRYLYQENRGKHVAHNRGVCEAHGDFFIVLDSDDACVPEALERLKYHWDRIPLAERTMFCGVMGLCATPQGQVVGPRFPLNELDSDFVEIATRYAAAGERWGFFRTDVLRSFPFPEIPGERFIPESVVWNRIARKYRTRFVNEVVRIYYDSPDGLMASSVRIRVQNPRSARLYYREFVDLPVSSRWILRNLVNYVRFSLHGRVSWRRVVSESGFPVTTLFLFVVGWLMYMRDRLHSKHNLTGS